MPTLDRSGMAIAQRNLPPQECALLSAHNKKPTVLPRWVF